MRSLHAFEAEILDIRISAANDSLWSLGATIGDRVRVALNDAIGVYKYRVSELFTSAQVTDRSVAIALPKNTDRVIAVHAIDSSGSNRIPIKAFNLLATPMTVLLRIDQQVKLLPGTEAARAIEIEYETRLKRFPNGPSVGAALSTGEINFISTTSNPPAYNEWESPGYFELSSIANTSRNNLREVIRYELALPTGFTGLTRGVEGGVLTWSGGDRVSPIFEGPPNAVPTTMAMAEAGMYKFWQSHRSLYDQWISVSGVTQLSAEELLGMIRTEEDRADRRYRKTKKLPRPGDFQMRRHRPE